MKRYFGLWLAFFKASWMADLEYRTNIVVKVSGELVWYVVQLSVFEVLYTHANSINGWDVHAMRVFMGSLFLIDNAYMVLFQDNMDNLNMIVRKGDLDLYLTKPMNSQFMVSFRKSSVAYLVNLMMIAVYLVWAVSRLNHPITAGQLLAFPVLAVCGLVCYYSLRFMFGAMVILLQDAGNVQFIWHQLFRLATRPDPIYPSFLRFLVLTLFPVGFMASVPARVFVEGVNPFLMLASPLMAGALLYLSHRFWNRALRSYSSASS